MKVLLAHLHKPSPIDHPIGRDLDLFPHQTMIIKIFDRHDGPCFWPFYLSCGPRQLPRPSAQAKGFRRDNESSISGPSGKSERLEVSRPRGLFPATHRIMMMNILGNLC